MARKKMVCLKVAKDTKKRKFVPVKEPKRHNNPAIVETVSVGLAKRNSSKDS